MKGSMKLRFAGLRDGPLGGVFLLAEAAARKGD
jgi:hypothetical protein